MKRSTPSLSRVPLMAMLLTAALIAGAIAYLSFANSHARADAAEQSAVSSEIAQTTAELLSTIKDAETGQRGFLITGREEYLKPHGDAAAAIPTILNRFRRVTESRMDQRARLDQLEPVVQAKMEELARLIEVRRTRGMDAARELVETDRGKRLMDEIRLHCDEIRKVAEGRLRAYTARAEASATKLRLVSTGGSLLLLFFLGVASVSVMQGLANREQLFRQAAENAEHLRVTLNSIGDAVIATDENRRITFINPVAERLTGWPESEVLGKPISDVFRIVDETSRETAANPLDRAIDEGVITGLANHTVLIARDGSEIPIDDSGAPIRTEERSIIGAILVFRDISERRKMELKLKTSNEQLAEFVDGAAHDLKAPMRAILLYSQRLAAKCADRLGDDGTKYLDAIAQGARRTDKLLIALVDYARAAQVDLPDGHRANVDAAVKAALANLNTELEAARAEVVTGALPELPVHEAHLVRLFQNLVGNAVKYRAEAAPKIRISGSHTDGGWRVQVADNGLGIDASYRETIFQPFKRLHGEELPGSGIGLATCKRIIEGYGGKIWVEETPGGGSTFCFTVPDSKKSG